jgi:peptidyl-prolyl cis-trans isomerase C
LTERKKKLLAALLLLGLAAGLTFAFGGCDSRKEAVAKVDDRIISKDDLRRYLKLYRDDPAGRQEDAAAKPPPEGAAEARAALDQLIDEELLLQRARKRGWIKKNETDPGKRQAAVRRVLSELGHQVPYPSLPEARKYYDQHPGEFKVGARYRIEHLLFASEHEARQVRAEVKRGRLTLAAAGSQGLGGARVVDARQRPVTTNELSPELAKILPRLKPGQVSPVIATPYGYHLIRVIQRQPPGQIPFAEVENRIKDAIYSRRLRARYRDWLKQQKKLHAIEIFPEQLKTL